MTPAAFRDVLARLALTQRGAARLLGVNERTVRRWARFNDLPMPEAVRLLLTLADEVPEARAWLDQQRDDKSEDDQP